MKLCHCGNPARSNQSNSIHCSDVCMARYNRQKERADNSGIGITKFYEISESTRQEEARLYGERRY